MINIPQSYYFCYYLDNRLFLKFILSEVINQLTQVSS